MFVLTTGTPTAWRSNKFPAAVCHIRSTRLVDVSGAVRRDYSVHLVYRAALARPPGPGRFWSDADRVNPIALRRRSDWIWRLSAGAAPRCRPRCPVVRLQLRPLSSGVTARDVTPAVNRQSTPVFSDRYYTLVRIDRCRSAAVVYSCLIDTIGTSLLFRDSLFVIKSSWLFQAYRLWSLYFFCFYHSHKFMSSAKI